MAYESTSWRDRQIPSRFGKLPTRTISQASHTRSLSLRYRARSVSTHGRRIASRSTHQSRSRSRTRPVSPIHRGRARRRVQEPRDASQSPFTGHIPSRRHSIHNLSPRARSKYPWIFEQAAATTQLSSTDGRLVRRI